MHKHYENKPYSCYGRNLAKTLFAGFCFSYSGLSWNAQDDVEQGHKLLYFSTGQVTLRS